MTEDDDESLWCPIVYEFLPDFCYTCGIIGHTDKACGVVLAEGRCSNLARSCVFCLRRRDGRRAMLSQQVAREEQVLTGAVVDIVTGGPLPEEEINSLGEKRAISLRHRMRRTRKIRWGRSSSFRIDEHY